MGIKSFKAITPGQRFKTVSMFEQVTKSEPEKKMTKGIKKSGGRNNLGVVTSRHRGGGNKRKYRENVNVLATEASTTEYKIPEIISPPI